MNKIIIALGLSLAAATGASAESNFGPDRSPATPANELAEDYRSARSNIDYTSTASVDSRSKVGVARTQDDLNRELYYGH